MLLPRYVPRPDNHTTDSLDHLSCALPIGFGLKEFLRDKEFSSSILFVGGYWMGGPAGEVGPALSDVASNSDGIDDISVFESVQHCADTSQCVVNLFR